MILLTGTLSSVVDWLICVKMVKMGLLLQGQFEMEEKINTP